MAKQKAKTQVQDTSKATGKKINRQKRNSLERKSLPQCYKNLYRGEGRVWFRTMLKAWQEGRKKVKEPVVAA